ncbi:protein TIC 22-like, chloroplastic [Punica granatum]|uniref:Uncharacterized protein n=2 Tax=Punica granatum TaxID=22663 RepID=A0A218XHN1_PUNGR|nr:protein TIC 22-like, chloroplastic [Punica granatum]OWM84236.1 hypothetical protein CDL15_Pgr011621 [Punica granatum]PKI61152.1 hypothetical protein CRG98_018472 [Punica granatum]
MNFGNLREPERLSLSPRNQDQPKLPSLQDAFTSLQTHCSAFLRRINPDSLIPHLQSSLSNLRWPTPLSSQGSPAWASTTADGGANSGPITLSSAGRGGPMSVEDIEERLAGVPVYALSNSAEEFVLVSGVSTKKSLGLFCFREEDAEALLDQMKSMDPGMRSGSRVVSVALNKIFQLKVDGVAFRLIPEFSQIKNAIKVRQMDGFSDEAFPGVPIFQSRSLILKSRNKSYRPVFFRKEDLENSLQRASRQQNRLNPALRQGDIQVAALEEIIKGMKEDSGAKWDDVVFIPPGFDVSTDPSQQSVDGSSA